MLAVSNHPHVYREAGLMADAARGHAIGRRWRTHGQWDSSVKERSPA